MPRDLGHQRLYPLDEEDYGRLRGGRLVMGRDDHLAAAPEVTFYQPANGQWMELYRSVDGMNAFFAHEVPTGDDETTFASEHLLAFVRDNILGLRGFSPDEQPRTEIQRNAQVEAALARYKQPASLVVAGERWHVDFVLAFNNGAVEHWSVEGTQHPLRIRSLLQEQLAEPDARWAIQVTD